jgi:hypothetical protein
VVASEPEPLTFRYPAGAIFSNHLLQAAKAAIDVTVAKTLCQRRHNGHRVNIRRKHRTRPLVVIMRRPSRTSSFQAVTSGVSPHLVERRRYR